MSGARAVLFEMGPSSLEHTILGTPSRTGSSGGARLRELERVAAWGSTSPRIRSPNRALLED
jgi:hypothetical protein